MLRYFLIFFLFMCTSISNAEVKEKIILNLKDTKNLDFKFEQNVNGKIENGNCTIEYQNKKLGSYLLSEAIKKSFDNKINRVWVHTCSLDHKNALSNYISRGMTIFKTEILNI